MNGGSEASVQYLDEGWVSSWMDKAVLDKPPKLNKGSIFKIPHHIWSSDPNAYEPKVISIGPYHCEKPHLKAMEQVKLLYFQRILRRNPSIGITNYLQLIHGLVFQSQSCYSEEIKLEKEKEFLDMLLLDGCFIIELLLANHEGLYRGGEEDPILGNTPMLSLVVFDMMLLENQLPFFVLKEIFNLVHVSDEENSISLIKLIIELFDDLLPRKNSTGSDPSTNFYHLLHILHSCFIAPEHYQQNRATSQTAHTNSQRFVIKRLFSLLINHGASQIVHSNTEEQKESIFFIPCMTGLYSGRVNVRRKNDASFGLFVYNAFNIIEVSPVKLNSNTNSLFRNLIVFEQFFFPKVKITPVSTYVMFMSYLIQSEKDLELLEQRKVVIYTLDHKEDVLFFRKLCKDTIVDYNKSYISNLRALSIKVQKSYSIDWRRFRQKYHQVLGSPQLQVIIALYALLYTAIQTVFTILSYYYPPK